MKQKLLSFTILTALTSVFSISCGKADTNVELKSNTLELTNYVYSINQDFKSNFKLKYPYYHTFPVTLDNKIQIGNSFLKENEYKYNLETGEIYILKEYVNSKITITAEATNNSDSGYEAQFHLDDHVKIYIYKSEDYSSEPYLSDRAYSRDKLTGELTKDGTGEINVKVVPDDGYDIDVFWVRGLHNKVIDRSETNKDIYSITDIRSNLDINITSKKIYCKAFASKDNLDEKSIDFTWNYRNPNNVLKTTIKVSSNTYNDTFETTDLFYKVSNLSYDTKYDFSFIPTLKDGSTGSEFTCTRFLLNPNNKLNIPHFEINTQNNIWPQRKAFGPERRAKTSVCNEYQNTNISFIDASGNNIYLSSSYNDKIKIRGNSSSVNFTKQPYKLKLKNPFDLLKDFREPSSIDNTHKEWVLLPTDNNPIYKKEGVQIFNNGVANTFCSLLNFEYVPIYQFVYVVINNDYQGLYLLTEQVSRGSGEGENQGRYKIDKDGFIIENDLFEWSEDISFRGNLIRNKCAYTFKYPDTDTFNEDSECYKYIQNYVLKFESELKQQSLDCFKYFDITSLAKWLMLHEIIKTQDAPGSNMYVIKKNMSENSILTMGTPWDFDHSLYGTPDGESDIKSSDYFYYPWLKKFDLFNNKINEIYKSVRNLIIQNVDTYFSSIDDSLYNYLISFEIKRWNVSNEQQMSIQDQKSNIKTFLENRITYLDKVYNK